MSGRHHNSGLPRSRARRVVLATGAGLALSLIVRPAAAEDLAAAIAAFTGGAPVRPGKGKLDVPALVENGNTVPITVSVDSPMTATERVATIAIFNEKNPERGVAVFSLGPRAAKPSVSTHIRLAASQKLTALARMSDGAYWSATVDVVVTLAACIDGDNPV
jgi:sulfur-oxidizing protein SoxY